MVDINTLHFSAKRVIDLYLAEIKKIKPCFIKGVYITGSVVLDDFYPNKSDIDFTVFCNKLPDDDQLSLLNEIHLKIQSAFCKPNLNGYYVDVSLFTGNITKYPSFFEGRMIKHREYDLPCFSLYELKASSVCVYGEKLPVININENEVQKELKENINSYWLGWVKSHSKIGYKRLLLMLFPQLMEWGVLGVARQLYTLEMGCITSKYNAGVFFLNKYPNVAEQAVHEALRIRKTDMPIKKMISFS